MGLDGKVQEVLRHLDAAFGGASQYGDTVVGAALCGHINNSGTFLGHTPEEIIAAAATAQAARWEGMDDIEDVALRIRKGYGEALQRLQ